MNSRRLNVWCVEQNARSRAVSERCDCTLETVLRITGITDGVVRNTIGFSRIRQDETDPHNTRTE